MLFRKKKKEELHKGDIFLAKGIYLKKPELANGNIVMNCFLRSLIVFLLVFGSIGGFLSAFGIAYNTMLVIICYLLLSTYFSFLYAAPKMVQRDLGYILFFGVFVGAIYLLRVHANSGFYVVINTILQRAQAFFGLAGVREYEIVISNDYLTVAVVAVFIGMVEIIILNIWMYSTMSISWTILFTFPILLIPIYMNLTPGPVYLAALVIGYSAVIVFKANGHFVVFAWDTPFRVRGLKKDKVTYTQDSGIFRQILGSFGLMFVCLVVLVELLVPQSQFMHYFKQDKLHERTQEAIGNFILLGFEGMYNHYASTGGMSGGKLGGVSNIRPDYLPDLIVSYTPYSTDGIYLKAYTGGRYGDNEWESLYAVDGAEQDVQAAEKRDDVDIFEEESLHREVQILQNEEGPYAAYGVMDIRNVGADISYLYYPYYTQFDNYGIYNNHSLMPKAQGLGLQQTISYTYYPKIVWEEELLNVKPADIDTTQVGDVFLEVPEKNADVISEECQRIGLTSEMTEEEIVETLAGYFEENIPYTLKPGATPRNKDFINYFLKENRKGYCAHFASAATLIFRQMGIPARYVEGYAFSFEAALASDLNRQKQYVDYYHGYSAIGESAVLDIEVTDAMAHAWVEIYVEGFGWRVVDVTPGNAEQEEDEDDFWSAFNDVLNSDLLNGGAENNGGIFGEIDLQEYFWLVYVIFGMIAFLTAVSLGRIGIRKWSRYRRCHQENRREALIACYADLCDMIRVCDAAFAYCKSHREQLAYMEEHYAELSEGERIREQLEKISFSNGELPAEEMDGLFEVVQQIRRSIWKTALWKQKIKLMRR